MTSGFITLGLILIMILVYYYRLSLKEGNYEIKKNYKQTSDKEHIKTNSSKLHKIGPKYNFYIEIKKYYSLISNNKIPDKLLEEIINIVTDKIYDNYSRSWEQYPKSRKRYSKLKLEDLEHSFIHYLITDFIKERNPTNYNQFSKLILKMNDMKFDEYEKRKRLYETK